MSRLAHKLLILLAFSATACDDDPTPPADERTWSVTAGDLEVALMSVGGTAPDDIWAVGADAGQGGVVVHFDGTAWTRIPSGQAYDLWWVHAVARDRVFIGGAGATVLEWDGTSFRRHVTPGRAADTVFGIWASSATDVWAVGGRVGRYGFIWHYDGLRWVDVPLPDAVPLDSTGERPGLFKIWGRSASDLYAVGGAGLMLHYDGFAWSVVPTGTPQALFTVHGNADSVIAVGTQGVVIDGTGRAIGPPTTHLFQGAFVAPSGEAWIAGLDGVIYRRPPGGDWQRQETGISERPDSLHALWVDPAGDVLAVGGAVLTADLDRGVMFRLGPTLPTLEKFVPEPPGPPACPPDRVDIAPQGSIARRWNELLLDSIRRDLPRPGVHARNLFHASVAMYDAWAAFDPEADGYVVREKATAEDPESAREIAISHAVRRVLAHRYGPAIGGGVSLACYEAFMVHLGLDPADDRIEGDDPAALGNRIGQAVVDAFRDDGANEAADYADTTDYMPANAPLLVDRPGTRCEDPSKWQELNLAQGETQNGIIVPGHQAYIGANWGEVQPFALTGGEGRLYHDVEVVPAIDSPEMDAWVLDVIRRTADLDPDDGATLDISPAGYGNNPLGTDDGTGHALNPVTARPYERNVVPKGDFTRVLAEFWADGPKSETPPGHWNTLANSASDAMESFRPWGVGEPVGRLEWDVKLYFALNGAVHDAAITAWGIKRAYLTARPITLIRFKAGLGQSSDPGAPSFDPLGLPLEPGLVELITAESAAPGERHHALRWWIGQVAVRSWLGEPGNRKDEVGGVGWIRAVDWIPYQRRTFVTPAFPGLVSGHSTFSRAAARVLADFTGSAYFPGGLGEYRARAREYLVFEDGPSVDITLQWASYFDAADQSGQSRIWGGIHIWPDDYQGRQLGEQVGTDAAAFARTWIEGTAVP